MSTGTLYLIATPIGNLADITVRAIRLLTGIRLIAAEDTRRTGALIKELAVRYPDLVEPVSSAGAQRFISYRNENELSVAGELLALLEQGNDVALVSDAGTPLISDPGHIIVREALRRQIRVEPVPGPSSVLAALTASGMPSSSFSFFGYPPERQGKRIALFRSLLNHHTPGMTLIFLLTPHDARRVLEDIRSVYGDIHAVVMRELTKAHESRHEGLIHTLAAEAMLQKGESVLLFANRKSS